MRASFRYLRPLSQEEACQLKDKHKDAAKCIAGGSDLLIQWRRGQAVFDYCLDLTHISDLRHYECTSNELRIGAIATLSDLEKAKPQNQFMSCIGTAVKLMCTPQLRTLATAGGNLCNASPAGDLGVVFVALGAEVTLTSCSGERTIPIESFFVGVNKTQLGEEELLTGVRIALPDRDVGATFSRIGRTVVDIAQANVATCITVGSDGVIEEARIALGAVAPTPIRSESAEKMLLGLKLDAVRDSTIRQAADAAQQTAKPISDIRASAEYRSYVTNVLVRRSLQQSIQSIKGA